MNQFMFLDRIVLCFGVKIKILKIVPYVMSLEISLLLVRETCHTNFFILFPLETTSIMVVLVMTYNL